MRATIPFLLFAWACGAGFTLAEPVAVMPGATELSPSRSQYFSWINNRNEGSTEAQTLANLEFFKWLHDEYGMRLDIYAFDAGNIDGPKYYGSTSSDKFKAQFPRGFAPIHDLAASFGCRLGVWLGPDGFGDTPAEEQARIDMLAGLCRDYNFELFKMDAVCTQLRPEKQAAFARLMTECRKHSPDLILLNHRLELGPAQQHATTFLWEGAETYIDVHMTNSERTGTHNRVAAISRGLVPDLLRLTEDHGVCLSSCLDYWEDDLILQAFNRCLILAPELYGNPWFLRDDEFPRLARILTLHRRYRDMMVRGMVLDPERHGPLAVARGDRATRLVSLRNLDWKPVVRRVKLDASIGLETDGPVEVRLLHPSERILGNFRRGDEVEVEVLPFNPFPGSNHHLEEVFHDNQRRGFASNITSRLPGAVCLRREIREMTVQWKSYRYLRANPALIEPMGRLEYQVSRLPVYHLPKAKARAAEAYLQDGDICAITANSTYGYTSHVGLIIRLNGRAYFTHATSDRDKGRMTIIDRPITDYLNGSRNHAGIVICRPVDLPPSPLWQRGIATTPGGKKRDS